MNIFYCIYIKDTYSNGSDTSSNNLVDLTWRIDACLNCVASLHFDTD